MRRPVYLVRHGQSEWNVLRLTQGQTAHPRLTTLGRAQAGAAAQVIEADLARGGLVPGRVLTSDLQRAVETATLIGGRWGLVPELDDRLREQHLGRFQGRSYEETRAAVEALDESDAQAALDGGEPLLAVVRRMADVVRALSCDCVNVVVSHGDAIRAVVAHLTGSAPGDAPWIEVPNGAVARFDGRLTWL